MYPTDLIRLRDTYSNDVQDEALDLSQHIEAVYDATIHAASIYRSEFDFPIVLPPHSPEAISVARVIRIDGSITCGVRIGVFQHVDQPGYEIIAATGNEVREIMRDRHQLFGRMIRLCALLGDEVTHNIYDVPDMPMKSTAKARRAAQ